MRDCHKTDQWLLPIVRFHPIFPLKIEVFSYKLGDDLHVGISDSQSVIHSYWTNGITAEESAWNKSILVYQVLFYDISNKISYFSSKMMRITGLISRFSHISIKTRINSKDQ